jgi:hypothetical protein
MLVQQKYLSVFVRKSVGEWRLGKPRQKWKDNIKMDLKKYSVSAICTELNSKILC